MSYRSPERAQANEQQNSLSAQRKASAQFVDNRPSLAVQLQQQAAMAASSQVIAQLAQAEQMAGASVQQHAAAEEELPVQGKFATAQLEADEELLQGKFSTAQLAGAEEELLQGKFSTAQLTAQLASIEEEAPLQGKFTTAQREGTGDGAVKANNTGLPDQLKSGIENLSGYAMDDVKVHYNSPQPANLNAHAYAQGTDIHVAPGQEQHLPHEAWHVVQQKQGRVKPTIQMKAGVPVNDDAGLESEADVMGAKALAAGQSAAPAQRKLISTGCASVAQLARMKFVEEAGRRHYTDGWGDLYGIKSDSTLKSKVTHAAIGNWTQRIGEFTHATENVTRPCTIGFRNRQGKQDLLTSIYHCGPSSQ